MRFTAFSILLFIPTALLAAVKYECACHTQDNVREGSVIFSISDTSDEAQRKQELANSQGVECARRYGGGIGTYRSNHEHCRPVE